MDAFRIKSLMISIVGCLVLNYIALRANSGWYFNSIQQPLLTVVSFITPILYMILVINLGINTFDRKNNPSNDFGTKCVLVTFLISQIVLVALHLGLLTFIFL